MQLAKHVENADCEDPQYSANRATMRTFKRSGSASSQCLLRRGICPHPCKIPSQACPYSSICSSFEYTGIASSSYPAKASAPYQNCIRKNEGVSNSRREFPKLMAHHFFCDRHIIVDLAIVYLELESHKIWQYGSATGLGFDRRDTLAWCWTDYGKTGATYRGQPGKAEGP